MFRAPVLGIIVLVSSCVLALAMLGGGAATTATAAPGDNPVVIENEQPGTSSWQITQQAWDSPGQIKGYASSTSVNKGEDITFYVTVDTPQDYSIDIYRMGWYQGLGGRLMQHIGPLPGVHQQTCPTDATTGMTACNWDPSYTLTTQTSWTSGIYLALLTNAQGWQNYIVFVVRDDSRVAALLYQQPVTTYEAYNDYPHDNTTGKSLYEFNSYGANTVTGTPRAAKVSFDRPYADDGTGAAGQSFFTWEMNLVRWMEKSGYDVTYSTDIDTATNGSRLLNYRGFISAGHDEYWTKPMYDAVENARDNGVNLAFFGSDADAWSSRLESSANGTPNRVLVCYKDVSIDPETDPSLTTTNWRDSWGPNRPEQQLIGVQFVNQLSANVPYVVTNSSNWVYAGTGFKDGDTVPGLVGYEADRQFTDYAGPIVVPGSYAFLSHSPFTVGGVDDYSNSSVYQAPSGAWVFATGTSSWSWALDSWGDRNLVDPRIQTTTANVLDRFVGQAPADDFALTASPASASVAQGATTTYGVTVTPTGNFNSSVDLSVSGLPAGASGSFNPTSTTTSSTLTVSVGAATATGSYPFTITGTSGGSTHTASATLVVTPPPDFALTATPSSSSVAAGSSTTYAVTINGSGGFSGSVGLSLSGLPAGASGSFNPTSATTSSTLTVTTGAATTPGTYPLTISGTSGGTTHTASVTLVVTAPPNFALTASPSSSSVVRGSSTTYALTIGRSGGFTGSVRFTVSGLPAGASGSFSPNPGTTGSTLTVRTSGSSTPVGTYSLVVSGVGGGLTRTVGVTLVVNPAPDFTISASPASASVARGQSTTYAVTITPIGTFSSPVTLSVGGLPSGVTASFSPNPATTGATLTVTAGANARLVTATIRITGTGGGRNHNTTVTLRVTAT